MPSTMARIRQRFHHIGSKGLELSIASVVTPELTIGTNTDSRERTLLYDDDLEALVVVENE